MPPTTGRPPAPRAAARALLVALEAYRVTLSPLLGGYCRYLPSCSVYAEEAIRRHGARRGVRLAAAPRPPLPSVPPGRLRPRPLEDQHGRTPSPPRGRAVPAGADRLSAPVRARPRRPPRAGGPTAVRPAGRRPAAAPGIAPAGRACGPRPRPCPRVADARERRVEVQGEDATLAFTNRGARLVSWQLERYRDARGRPEEMVQTVPGAPRPLDVETGDPDLDARLREALFLPSGGDPGPARGRRRRSSASAMRRATWRRRRSCAFARAGVRGRGERVRPPRRAGAPVQGHLGTGGRQPHRRRDGGAGLPGAPGGGPVREGRGAPRGRGGLRPARRWRPSRWAGIESHYFAALWVPPGRAGHGRAARAGPPGRGGRQAAHPAPGRARPARREAAPPSSTWGPRTTTPWPPPATTWPGWSPSGTGSGPSCCPS